MSCTMHTLASSSVRGTPTAAPSEEKKNAKSNFQIQGTSFQVHIFTVRMCQRVSFRLTGRADMFEGGGSSHTESALKLPDQLPGIQSVTQVNKTGGAVDH